MRKAIIKNGDKELIFSICECILNSLNGNLKLSHDNLKSLEPYRYTLRNLIKKSNINSKKKLLIQRGGFLNILLPAIITGLATIISSTINKE